MVGVGGSIPLAPTKFTSKADVLLLQLWSSVHCACGALDTITSHWPTRRMYGKVYGMQKTTVYIPEDLKKALGRVAAMRGMSEAELIREALRTLTSESSPPEPRLPLFKSGKPHFAENVDEALSGFGET